MDEINFDEAVADISSSLGFEEELGDTGGDPPSPTTIGTKTLDETQVQSTNTQTDSSDKTQEESQQTTESENKDLGSSEPPPKTWRPEAAALWKDLPPAVRAEVQKREEDMFKGIEGYKQDANTGKALKDVVSPYLADMQSEGIDPMQEIQSLLYAHHTLVKGTDEQRREVFKHLLREYNVTLDPASETSSVDPTIQALKNELGTIKSYLNNTQQQQLDATKASLRRDIETFAQDPAHAHFEDVVADMTNLIKSGVAANLKDAYQQAIWLNPVVREKELSRITAEKEAAHKKATEEAIQNARKASEVNLRTKAKSRSGTAPTGTMDETLSETLKEIRSRSN